MKTKQVEIVLKNSEKPSNETPVKKRERPTAFRFAFTPRCMPQLTTYFKSVNWNSVDRTLAVVVEETSDFGVCEWLQYINRRYKESQSGPFNIDLAEDAIDLKPLSEEGKTLAVFRFKGISIEAHSCPFSGADTFSSASGYLRHEIVLLYQSLEQIAPEEDTCATTNELADEEWQTVEA